VSRDPEHNTINVPVVASRNSSLALIVIGIVVTSHLAGPAGTQVFDGIGLVKPCLNVPVTGPKLRQSDLRFRISD
jgi:hypothetical protein